MSAVTPLRAQQTALANTMHGLTVEMSQLNNLESLLSSNETILHRAMRDADRVLEDAKRRQIPNVDDVLIAPTVVSRQLYEAVADERATEDCRNVLAKALDKGRINSNMWAKVSGNHTQCPLLRLTGLLANEKPREGGVLEESPHQKDLARYGPGGGRPI